MMCYDDRRLGSVYCASNGMYFGPHSRYIAHDLSLNFYPPCVMCRKNGT